MLPMHICVIVGFYKILVAGLIYAQRCSGRYMEAYAVYLLEFLNMFHVLLNRR